MAAESRVVLDSSALLAWLGNEPGAEAVARVLDAAVISSVNLAEVMTKLLQHGATAGRAEALLQALKLETVPWTEDLLWQGRDLGRLAWTHGLSLADRACLTTARALGYTALTCDAVWLPAARSLQPPLPVALFRRPRPRP